MIFYRVDQNMLMCACICIVGKQTATFHAVPIKSLFEKGIQEVPSQSYAVCLHLT